MKDNRKLKRLVKESVKEVLNEMASREADTFIVDSGYGRQLIFTTKVRTGPYIGQKETLVECLVQLSEDDDPKRFATIELKDLIELGKWSEGRQSFEDPEREERLKKFASAGISGE